MTPKQVADRLQVSERTVQREIQAGRLEAPKTNGTRQISEESLTAYLKAHRVPAPPEEAPPPPGA
jgi:excisionase family DNA binding protein